MPPIYRDEMTKKTKNRHSDLVIDSSFELFNSLLSDMQQDFYKAKPKLIIGKTGKISQVSVKYDKHSQSQIDGHKNLANVIVRCSDASYNHR